ncbi:hypothetical protein [Candidatus Binatus soli]|jgi:sugar phosphate permease|uniref:hypothetical protein n=1 Tax=Candidatus Binatus soli TaxID=1953413 RepID=UPI003D13F77F
MNAKRHAIEIAVAIFIWINVLTVLLSTYQYGYVDWAVVGRMGLLAFPPLAVAAVFALRAAHQMAKGANRGAASELGNAHRTAAAGR